jgi:hypothetical protein
MLKTTILAAVLVASTAGLAHAGGQPGTIGVGAEFQIVGLTGGASVNYDAGPFHVGGFFGFADPPGGDNTSFNVGGRFYYHVHSTAMADFGIGGSLGILNDHDAAGNGQTSVFIEPGVQIRLFLAANVAVSAATGIIIGTADASGVAVTGQTITGGIHYYFF